MTDQAMADEIYLEPLTAETIKRIILKERPGMEHKVCIDSEIVVLAEGDGVVTAVDANHVSVKYDNGRTKEYKLVKFLRSNHGTCINQRPIVQVGERVHGGEDPSVLADGPRGTSNHTPPMASTISPTAFHSTITW